MKAYRRRLAALGGLALVLSLLLYPAQPAEAAPPSQAPAVDAKIQIVWPHDAQGIVAPVDTAPLVNVEVYLFERGTLNPVSCDFANKVTLRWSTNEVTRGGVVLVPAHEERSAVGQRVIRTEAGKTFPAWVFNDVPVHAGKTYFFLEVEGVNARTNAWAHSADPRTILPYGVAPTGVQTQPPGALDALIQIVWPHDTNGDFQPVERAPLANIGVDLALHPVNPPSYAWSSVGFEVNQPVRLLRALNSGYLEPVKAADQVLNMTGGDRAWPRWIFNDVDVSAARDPQNKYYFAVQADGVETHTTIWTHGADARTYFPQKDIPTRSCQN